MSINLRSFNDYDGPWAISYPTRDEAGVFDENDPHGDGGEAAAATAATAAIPKNSWTWGPSDPCRQSLEGEDDEDDEEDDPLRPGLWMDGDSLAPPCGTPIWLVRTMLEFASVGPNDVLYDLGCGDGRVCLEAYARHGGSGVTCVGVEIEEDLVRRFEHLIRRLPIPARGRGVAVRAVRADLRAVLAALVEKAEAAFGVAGAGDQEGLIGTVEKEKGDGATSKVAPPTEEGTAPPSRSSLMAEGLNDLPLPTVVALYLLPEAVALIEPMLLKLLRLVPGSRVVCNTWGLKSIEPVKTLYAEVADDERSPRGGREGSALLRLFAGESWKGTMT